METLIIIFGLAILAAVLFGYYALWQWVNAHCASKYQFIPLNGWSLSGASIAAVGLHVGIYMITDGGGIPPLPWPHAFLHTQAANGLVLASVGGLFGLGTLGVLVKKTSLLSGLLAGLVLAIAGTAVFLVVVILILLLLAAAQGGRRRRVYIED